MFLVVLVVAAIRLAVGQSTSDFEIIVHPSNSVNSLSTREVSRFFLEGHAEWPNGTIVVAIDQTPDSPVRIQFSNEILGRDVASVRAHWRRLIFQGTGVPPPTRATEEEIILFVSANRTAVGYVSKESAARADVKVIKVTE